MLQITNTTCAQTVLIFRQFFPLLPVYDLSKSGYSYSRHTALIMSTSCCSDLQFVKRAKEEKLRG